MNSNERKNYDFKDLSVAIYVVIGTASCFTIFSLMVLAELRSGRHRLKLRYSRMLTTTAETDMIAVQIMYAIVFSEIFLGAYLVLLVIRVRKITATSVILETNYILLLQAISIFLCSVALLTELKQWLKQFLRLKSANQLIGDAEYNVVIIKTLQYFSFFMALVIFSYFVIIGYSTQNGTSQANDTLVQLFLLNNLSNIGIATVFLVMMAGFLYIGYNLWEQSGTKYGHDVEDMRITIKRATMSVSASLGIASIFFYLQSILRSEIFGMADQLI